MTINTLASWHQVVKGRDMTVLDSLLSDDVVFYSPVVHAPQIGKAITTHYLAAALRVFLAGDFHYTREITSHRNAVLEFEVELDGLYVNGVDLLKWDDAGRIVEFKVMIRPLKAIRLIHEKMAAMLSA